MGASVPLVPAVARTMWGQPPRLSSRAQLDRAFAIQSFLSQESAGCGGDQTHAELRSAGQARAAVPA